LKRWCISRGQINWGSSFSLLGNSNMKHACKSALLVRFLVAVLAVQHHAAGESVLAAVAVEEKVQPNVVLIFADDLGYGDLSCYGATKLKTPNIDALAKQGRRFTDAHSASAVCTPSRYALLSGEYPFRKGLSRPVFLKTGLVFSPDRTTIADVMKRAGYATACIGKWHLGFGEKAPNWNGDLKPGPLEVGFDYYFGVPIVNSHPPFVYVENHRVVGLVADDPFVFGKKANTQLFPEKMGLTQIGGANAAHALYKDEAVGTKLANKSVQWIKSNKDKPFFLYLATTNIHHPFTPAKRFQGTSQCGRYGDFVHELDWIVGQVVNTLKEQGLAENTLVIFTSDNGGMINQGGQNAVKMGHRLNDDLLGFKFDAWEGGHRVPLIARWPGRIEAGSTSDQLVCNVDLLATFAALTGKKLAAGEGPDSFNMLPALTGEPIKPIRGHLVLGARQGSHLALRQGQWVYIGAKGGGGFTGSKPGQHALGGPAALKFAGQVNSDVVNGKIKRGAPPAQLYNLASDPSQGKNVIRMHAELAKKLAEQLKKIRASKMTRP
jgi:arylsulfatase A